MRRKLRDRRRAERWEAALQRLGPYTRGLIDSLLRPDACPRRLVRQALGPPHVWRGEGKPVVLALTGVMVHGALDVFIWLLDAPWSPVGRAYELYACEDVSVGGEAPPTLGGALVRALLLGELALTALVAAEVAGRLDLPEPAPRLAELISRHIDPVKLLAHETYRVVLEREYYNLSAAGCGGAGVSRPARDLAAVSY